MSIIKNITRIIGQSISIFIFSNMCLVFFEYKIPGNHTHTDDDAALIFCAYVIVLVLGIGLFINSIFYRRRNHWKYYRVLVMVYVLIVSATLLISREFVVRFYLGEKKVKYLSTGDYFPDMIRTKLVLYENNNFLCTSSYGGEITVETTGKYKKENDSLSLSFVNKEAAHIEKYYQTLSNNIGTRYGVQNDTLICLDCEIRMKLIQKNY